MSDEGFAFLNGFLIAMLLALLIGQVLESQCQQQNNVADCELVVGSELFRPVTPEKE